MTSQADHNLLQQDLASLLDGELDSQSQARVQAHLKAHPETGSQIAAMAMLKHQLAATMRQHTPPTPADLKQQLLAQFASPPPEISPEVSTPQSPEAPESLVAASHTPSNSDASALKFPTHPTTSPSRGAAGPTWRTIFWRWAPAAVAAGFFVAASITFWQQQADPPTASPGVMARIESPQADPARTFAHADRQQIRPLGLSASPSSITSSTQSPAETAGGSGASEASSGGTIVTASMAAPVTYAQLSSEKVQALGGRHRMCSRQLEALNRGAEFPRQLDQMPKAIAGCIGKTPRRSLDLSRAGYEFTRAGECTLTGQRAVHLVYRAKTHGEDSVSLWVTTYDGRPEIRQGVVYQGNVADSDIPLFFWRQDDLIYYMVGNSFDRTRQAAQNLVVAAR